MNNKNTETNGYTGPPGPYDGSNGSNDYAYINFLIRNAAEKLVRATILYSEGHYPHSNAKVIPKKHPLVLALNQLSKYDKETARFNNIVHDPKLFIAYTPPIENQTRWNKFVGPKGIF